MIFAEENKEKNCFKSQGEITIRGERIKYNTVCEDNFLVGSDGNPAGTIFSYAYLRSDVDDAASRPILFGYNGGPGAGSLWLHLGILGPRRVKIKDEINVPTVTPFELEDNPNCLLDMCDIVIVDPVGCGMGRLFNDNEKEKLFGFEPDAHAQAIFIDEWLTRHGRRNSPILLMGESYGTGRVALLIGELFGVGAEKGELLGISVTAAMFLGSYFFEELPVEKTALHMSNMAATNWYHHPEGKPPQQEFIEMAREFAATEYISAVFKGDELGDMEREAVIEKMSYFTGIKRRYIRQHAMKIDAFEFKKQLLEEEEQIVGLYDGRFKWQAIGNIDNANVRTDDPAMAKYTPAYQAGMGLLRKELKITFDRANRASTDTVSEAWIRTLKLSPAKALAGAMRRNPQLKVFFATGIYDLCTTAGIGRYLAYHSDLDVSRVTVGEYPSGHMAYLGEKSGELLAKDMRSFFSDALKTK